MTHWVNFISKILPKTTLLPSYLPTYLSQANSINCKCLSYTNDLCCFLGAFIIIFYCLYKNFYNDTKNDKLTGKHSFMRTIYMEMFGICCRYP